MNELPRRVAEKIATIDEHGCWRWLGAHSAGRARVWWGNESVDATRVVWEHLIGPIPDGLELDHVRLRGCVWLDCVNPAHLEPVTHRVNVQRLHSCGIVGKP